MAKFRKKPVVIQAFQMTKAARGSLESWPDWLRNAWIKDGPGGVFPVDYPDSDGEDQLKVKTLEGDLIVSWGDWIIQGVQLELYPCKPDIFEATYEPAE